MVERFGYGGRCAIRSNSVREMAAGPEDLGSWEDDEVLNYRVSRDAPSPDNPADDYYNAPQHKRLYFCYLLRSCDPKHPLSTYIGFTVDPKRRLRQHNGEICSGAKRTHTCRPWEFVAIVHGFASKNASLRFEWHLHHPRSSSKLRDKLTEGLGRGHGAKNKLSLIKILLSQPPFDSQALGIRFPKDSYAHLAASLGCCKLTRHILRISLQPI